MRGKSLQLPSGYQELLQELKRRIRSAQVRASFAVSRELVLLYWSIGRDILASRAEKVGRQGYRPARPDLQKEFPGVEGFSPRNLKYMRCPGRGVAGRRNCATAYCTFALGAPCGCSSTGSRTGRRGSGISAPPSNTAGVRMSWSLRSRAGCYEREGKALTNFKRKSAAARLGYGASRFSKDPYNFDFLTVTATAGAGDRTRPSDPSARSALRAGPRLRLRWESGTADVDDQTFYIDLLFYHVRLHCYFVIELKTGEFQPEYAGKLSFYFSAVDDLFEPDPKARLSGFCCVRAGAALWWNSLSQYRKPIGVSTYQVTRELPEPVREELPSVEDLQEVVNKLRSEMESLRKEPADEQ